MTYRDLFRFIVEAQQILVTCNLYVINLDILGSNLRHRYLAEKTARSVGRGVCLKEHLNKHLKVNANYQNTKAERK